MTAMPSRIELQREFVNLQNLMLECSLPFLVDATVYFQIEYQSIINQFNVAIYS